jgi:thiamine pyrophosphate-dependent acetolactate synthase large subunit-like protein
MKKVADQLVDQLVQAGIRRIHAIPGDSLNELNDAVRRRPDLQWIHLRNEEAVAFAASADAQLPDSNYFFHSTICQSVEELETLADLINRHPRLAIFCGHGAAQSHGEVVRLAELLKAPVANRIQAVFLLHQKLCRGTEGVQVGVGAYMLELLQPNCFRSQLS